MPELELATQQGKARVHLRAVPGARAALILSHGAGGGVGAADLQAAAGAARAQRFTVALIEQPYRVAGRRAPAPAARLDSAWLEVIEQLRGKQLGRLPLVLGGRSMGARVACRTAASAGAVGVVCLAFPLLPPRRAAAKTAPLSRLDELEALTVPTLVVQGARDPFGVPPPGANRTVVEVAGDHSLRTDLAAVEATVERWLAALSGTRGPA